MASLASLPTEIMQNIVHLAIEADTKAACEYATVSRDWQYHVEEKTFLSLRVSSTGLRELRDFVTPMRQSYVRKLAFKVILPEYDAYDVDILNRNTETPEDQDSNNRCFTDAIVELFDVVASWQPPPGSRLGQPGVCLDISASSPCDIEYYYTQGSGQWHKLWQASVLEIVHDGNRRLPILNAVTTFICGDLGQSSRKIAPKACCDMAARMLNVQKLDWYLFADTDFDLDRRVRMREGLIAGLQRLPDSVRHFGLCCVGDETVASDRWWEAPRLFGGDQHTPDPLGVALRKLLQQLVTFTLSATVSPEVFWPVASLAASPGLDGDNSMSFPYLEVVSLILKDITPAGEWRSIGLPEPSDNVSSPSWRPDFYDNDHDDDPYIYTSDNRRFSKDQVNKKLVDTYLLAAGYSAQRMPKLKRFRVQWPFRLESFGLDYYHLKNEDSRAILEVSDAPPSEPSPEVVEAWRQVAGNLLGDPMLMDIEFRDTTGEYPLFR